MPTGHPPQPFPITPLHRNIFTPHHRNNTFIQQGSLASLPPSLLSSAQLTSLPVSITAMKLSLIALSLLFASLGAAIPSADADADAAAVPDGAGGLGLLEARDGVLEKRACSFNGCSCRRGTRHGYYCHGCGVLTNTGHSQNISGSPRSWVYECWPSGRCCTYGYHQRCDRWCGRW